MSEGPQVGPTDRRPESNVIQRVDPRSDSYSALMWDVVTNMHRYQPREGDKVLDLGAHYGLFALYCAARGAHVDAYEPQRTPFMELCHQAEVAAEIGMGDIHPHERAVWSAHGIIALSKAKNGSTATASAVRSAESIEGQQRVVAVPFDELLNVYPNWDCVKMDVEGAEHEILTTSKHLDRIRFLTVEIHNDLLSVEQTNSIEGTLKDSFPYFARLPRKDKPSQSVAWFCRR